MDIKNVTNEQIEDAEKIIKKYFVFLVDEKDVSATMLSPFLAQLISGVYRRMGDQFFCAKDKQKNGITGHEFLGFIEASITELYKMLLIKGDENASTDKESGTEDYH